jgi:hypothetical protein
MLPVTAVALMPLLHERMVGLGCGGFDSVVRETNDSFRPVCNRLEQDMMKAKKKDMKLVFYATPGAVPGEGAISSSLPNGLLARSRYPTMQKNLVKISSPVEETNGRSTCALARVSGRSRGDEPSAGLRTTAQELESAIPFRIPAFANTDSCPHAASFLQELGRTCSSPPPRSSSSPPAAHARLSA